MEEEREKKEERTVSSFFERDYDFIETWSNCFDMIFQKNCSSISVILFYFIKKKIVHICTYKLEEDVNEMRVKVYEKEDTNSNIVYLFIYHDRA